MGRSKTFLPVTSLGFSTSVAGLYEFLGRRQKDPQPFLHHSMKPGLGYSSSQAVVPSALQTSLGTWMELMEQVGTRGVGTSEACE